MFLPRARAFDNAPQGKLGRRPRAIEQGPGGQAADALVKPQHEREGTESPPRRDLAQQAILPRSPRGKQFAADLPRQRRRQFAALLVDGRAQVFDGRHGFVQAAAAAFQGLGGQVEKVGAANPGGRGPGELPREQIDQGGKLPLRRTALLGIGQGGQRIDEEDVTGLIPRFQRVSPVVANIGVLVGMGLHEDQPCSRGGGGKLLGHAGAAVLLLRGGHDQDVAQRQDPPQPGQRRVGRQRSRGIGRIGVGAIDKNQVRQRRKILLDQIDLAGHPCPRFRASVPGGRAGPGGSSSAGCDRSGPIRPPPGR